MGGDHAPNTILDGLALAIEMGFADPGEVLVVGRRDVLEDKLTARGLPVDLVVDAVDELTGDETPVEALRKKPQSSIAVGLRLVKAGQADAFVSAGNTGFVVAAATLTLGCLEGIRRPGICLTVEGDRGPFMVIDVGANPQPKPRDILEYAVMGGAYYHDTYAKEKPSVGLMNIGSEEKKGNPLIKEARRLLRESAVNFIGNVEGGDLFHGTCDVIVTDGFTGNVLLKVSEGMAEYVVRTMARLMGEAGIAGESLQDVVRKMRARVDYSEFGGALLLGVDGIVTICHGKSEGRAMANAIRVAKNAVGARVNEHIVGMAREGSRAT
jgi:glycerol-3-phosphate acyltransferase PlsX